MVFPIPGLQVSLARSVWSDPWGHRHALREPHLTGMSSVAMSLCTSFATGSTSVRKQKVDCQMASVVSHKQKGNVHCCWGAGA